MREVKLNGISLLVCALVFILASQSLALSQLTTDEMAQIKAGCKECVDSTDCNDSGCDSSPCTVCNNATNYHIRCVGPKPDPACRQHPNHGGCGYWAYGQCINDKCGGTLTLRKPLLECTQWYCP